MTSEDPARPTDEESAGTAPVAPAADTPTPAAEIARGAAERLAFFSDAVVAIAITLLAIDLPVPRGETDAELWRSIGEESFTYLTFLISFIAIANHWSAHHRAFRWVARADRPLILLNLLWLLFIVLTPFLTEVVREGEELTWSRFGLYAGAQAVLLFLLAAMISRLSSRHMFIDATPATFARRGWVGAMLTGLGFALSIPVFPLLHGWSFAVWVLVPVVGNRVVQALGWVRADDHDTD
ncbi:DUF1211 domain-containing membrane protein [Pseudonocardia sulfidoxydans NBRC 16205]|uniref:DUF1211 domain-containing membrane protein n=1 Tax=Pseudonocardia sulfidoxydans NBRC 16205 TaxID=1223511 RepID=A0A511DLG6_9PSEU|nr:TMEM175 family protein [Pseudonocardia sulfidoxydans]GEL25635.1 DUF1211 domain-containing membrane protein [Pseudonocardia sulfidoxydans NBRC 16205]